MQYAFITITFSKGVNKEVSAQAKPEGEREPETVTLAQQKEVGS